MPFIKAYQVTDGVLAADSTPTTEELYCTPTELMSTFGCEAEEATIRFAQGVINAYIGRASLWPCEILEELQIPYGRQEVRLAVTPIVSILEAAGRYGQARRDKVGYNNAYLYDYNQMLVLASAGRPSWVEINVDHIEVNHAAGIAYMPLNIYLNMWRTVRLRYIGGYLSIPFRIKTALAEILNTMAQKGVSDRTRRTVGRVSSSYASDQWVTPAAAQMLEPFRVQTLL